MSVGCLKWAELKVLKGHTDKVTSVAFCRDSTHIVSGSQNGFIQVWDALSGAQLKVLNSGNPV